MKSLIKLLFVPFALASLLAFTSLPAFPQCTPTGFTYDGNSSLTAALINPTTTVTGTVPTGCDIGVYFDNGKGSVDKAVISGFKYFGVVVNGDVNNVSVDVTNSTISNIGDNPLDGNQYGVAIYYRAFYLTSSASGTISGNQISTYQKGGIVTNGQGTSVVITDNTVTGLGPTDLIAQNGIEIGYGASASVMSNTVTGNSYTGNSTVSVGILPVGGPFYSCPDGNPCPYTVGTRIVGNTVTGNDVAVYIADVSAGYNAATSATNIKVVNNTLTNLYVNNGAVYQAGVSDGGMNDKIINNTISGYGYDPNTISGSTFSIDYWGTASKIHANAFDGVKTP